MQTLFYAALLTAGLADGAQVQDWIRPCTIGGTPARCGTLQVPETRRRHASRTISLKVVVLPKLGAGPAGSPLFVLDGGPGTAATARAEYFASVFRPVRQSRDIVLVDQRGTGGSNPLDCAPAPGTFVVPRDTPRCLARLSSIADLSSYSTADFIEDLEAVRSALGYDRMALHGGSYGTRAAYLYARLHPSRIQSLVLVAAAPVSLSLVDSFEEDGRAALDALVADCVRNTACAAAFPRLPADVERVRNEIRERYLVIGLQFLQYSSETLGEIPLLITKAAAGDRAPLRAAVDAFRERIAGQMHLGLHLSVMCSEEAPFGSASARRQPGLGGEFAQACAGWPTYEWPADRRALVRLTQPALVIAGAWDPVTAPRWARLVAGQFSPHELIIVPRTGHIIGDGACLASMTRDFLDGQPVDARCAARTPGPSYASGR